MTNTQNPAGLSSFPQYRVVADRDKGDDPQPAMIQDGDRVTVVAYNAHDGSWQDGNEGIIRIERPVPTTDEPVMLTYEGCKKYPLGTVVADADGYWSRQQRHYVKTSRNTWASFWKTPTVEQITEAVKEERNNLSPCPSGYLAYVTEPAIQTAPSVPTREQIAEALAKAYGWESDSEVDLRAADAVLALLTKEADRD